MVRICSCTVDIYNNKDLCFIYCVAATEIKCDIPALKMLLGAKERAEEKIDQRIDFVKKAEKKIEFALQRMQHSKKLRHSANHKTLQHKLETLKNTEKELMRRKSMSASKSPGTHMVKEMTGSHSVVEHKKMPHSKMPAQQSNYFPETKQVLLEKLDNMKNVVHDLEERMQQIESSKDESSPKNVVSDDYNDYSEMSDASRSGTIMYDSREGDYSEEMSHETKMPESSRSNEMSDNSYSDDMSEDWSDEEATDMDYDEELDYSNKRKKRSVQKPTDIHSLIQNLLGGLGKSEVGVLKKIVAALKEDDVESK